MQGFLAIPADSIVRLRDARIPAALLIEAPPCQIDSDGLAAVDLEIQHGQISAIAPAGTFEPKTTIDLAGGQVWPGYADIHTHLDKGFILPRAPNPDRTFKGAFTNVAADRSANWTADDLRRRFDFALRCAYAHGTTALRTHIDSLESQAYISWGVFREMRELWAGRIELQASSLVPIDVFGTPYGKTLADIVAVSGGNLGAVTRLTGASTTRSLRNSKHCLTAFLHWRTSADSTSISTSMKAANWARRPLHTSPASRSTATSRNACYADIAAA